MLSRIYIVAMLATLAAWATASADISPTLRMEFQVQSNGLNDVMAILTGYAKTEGLAVENVGDGMPPRGNRPVFYVKLTRKDVPVVIVTNFINPDQMLLGYYAQTERSEADHGIEPLISALRERWPDIHVYTGL